MHALTHNKTFSQKAAAILTDIHFLVPLAVFFIGLALLITLH
ncbi:MAG: translocated intimin receptor Tir [Terracidiphilus sp.]